MMTNFEFAKTLVSEHQKELERDATRWRLARLVRRANEAKAETPLRAPVPMPSAEPTSASPHASTDDRAAAA